MMQPNLVVESGKLEGGEADAVLLHDVAAHGRVAAAHDPLRHLRSAEGRVLAIPTD